jgi:hypothetical protein
MRYTLPLILVLLITACNRDDYAFISLKNDTGVPIFALPYSAQYTNGDWIGPGETDEFYTLETDHLNAFEYFSYYYDSLVVYMEGSDDFPVKFYKNGHTVNYDPTLNPFTNREVWIQRNLEMAEAGSGMESVKRKHVLEHYFTIKADKVKSLGDTLWSTLHPAL